MSTKSESFPDFIMCSQCKKEILKEVESFLELDGRFYHADCYSCRTCYKKFPVDELVGSIAPFADTYGVLYCRQHFIKYVMFLLKFYLK